MRKSKPTVAVSIDGKSEDVPNHFAKIYSDLYNSVDDKDDLVNLKANLEEQIDLKSLDDVNKVTELKSLSKMRSRN